MSFARTFTLGSLELVALGCTIAQPTMPPASDAGDETVNVSALGGRRTVPASGSSPSTGARTAAPPARIATISYTKPTRVRAAVALPPRADQRPALPVG